MSYQVLARKYRPSSFNEVVGQESVGKVLTNAVEQDRVHHAYLFAGPRGVGKTSMARIFAKALCCEKGPTVTPCNKCAACEDINLSRSLDVIEIDGASNRGIDDIREIRESVKFAPPGGRFKIYIIDEVHQITNDGFNALLKTLEEPPAHAKFVFATTEPEKIPATILSRCQRFEFKRITTSAIEKTLQTIAKKEKIKISKEALHEIAKAADGSLRDSQSLLDQAAAFSGGEIGTEQIIDMLGLVSPDELTKLFNAIIDKDASAVLSYVKAVFERGKEPSYLLERCLEHTRNLMVVQTTADSEDLVEASDSYLAALKEQVGSFSKADLFYIFSILSQGMLNIRRFKLKRIPMEMALLKCLSREPMVSLDEAKSELPESKDPDATLKPNASPQKKAASEKESSKPKNTSASKKEEAPQASSISEPLAKTVQEEIPSGELQGVWKRLVERMREDKMSAAAYLMEGTPVKEEDGFVVIGFKPEFSFHAEALNTEENTKLIEKHLSALLDKRAKVSFKLEGEEKTEEEKAEKREDPKVKSAFGIFGGRVIS